MALRRCVDCTTLYAVGLDQCPHCRSAESIEEGSSMPKISVNGGATNAPADASVSEAVTIAQDPPDPPLTEGDVDRSGPTEPAVNKPSTEPPDPPKQEEPEPPAVEPSEPDAPADAPSGDTEKFTPTTATRRRR